MSSLLTTPTRRLPPEDHRRGVTVGSAFVAVAFSIVSVVGLLDPASGGANAKRIVAAVVCWIAFALARRGHSSFAALLTLGVAWLEINASFLSATSFPADGMMVTPAIIAIAALLFGPRVSLGLAVVSIAITGPLLRMSPGLASTGYTKIAVLWLTVHALVTFALWVVMTINLSALARVLHDVTEKERELADMIRFAPDGILVTGADDQVLSANPAAERILGLAADAVIGQRIGDVLVSIGIRGDAPVPELRAETKDAPEPRKLLRGGREPVHVELTAHQMDGGRRQVVLRDVSERVHSEVARRDMESHLAHGQRMEAIGQLAGGIAHDFNNLLTAVGGSAEVLREELVDSEQLSLLDEIMAAQERGAGLTRQLLAFARRDSILPRVFNLSTQAAQLQPLLQRVAGEQVRLFMDLEPDCQVLADVGRIEQALVNLVANARDAMPEGGSCGVRVASVMDAAKQRWVSIEVSDEGVGMDSSTIAHAFEPFFTTKSRGRGTGLGLASVHGIASQSGGRARINSTVGVGTTVTVELPYAAGVPAAMTVAPKPIVTRGGATILVAEDDDATRSVVNRVLLRAGYQVLLAPDGVQALRLGESDTGRIALVLSDVIMPGLTGPQLALRLRECLPTVPVLFMSGYPADELSDLPDHEFDRDFLPKPFTTAGLLERVASKLASAERTPLG